MLASSSLVSLGEHAPDGPGRDVTLGLSSTTTMGMVAGVHGHTSHGGPDSSPPRSSGLSERLVLVVGRRHHSDGRRGLEMHVSLFAALHSDDCLVFAGLLSNETAVGACSSAELGSAQRLGGDGVDDGTDGDHPHGQTVTLSAESVCQHGRVGLAVELVNDVLGDSAEERLDSVASSRALGRGDVRVVAGGLVLEQRNVAASVGVSFDSHDFALSALLSEEVNEPHSSPVSTALVTGDDSACVGAAAVSGLSGHGQRSVGLALPQVRVDGGLVPPHGRRDGRHGLELDRRLGDLPLRLHVDVLLLKGSQIHRIGHQRNVAERRVSGVHGGLRVHKRLHSGGSHSLPPGGGASHLLFLDKGVFSGGLRGFLVLTKSPEHREGAQSSRAESRSEHRLDGPDASQSGRQVAGDESVHVWLLGVGDIFRVVLIWIFQISPTPTLAPNCRSGPFSSSQHPVPHASVVPTCTRSKPLSADGRPLVETLSVALARFLPRVHISTQFAQSQHHTSRCSLPEPFE